MRLLFCSLFALLLSTSCGLLSGDDKYVDATVADAVSGAVPSKTYTYRFVDPNIIAVEKDYALLKDGNMYQILSCDGFEDTLAALDGADHALLVRLWGNPYPHFRLRAFEVGEARRPVSWVLADSELPLLIDRKMYDTSFFETIDLAAWSESPPPSDMVDKQILVRANIERVVEERVVEEAEGMESADTLTVVVVETVRYFLVAGDVKIELAPVAENGVRLLLEGMAAEGMAVRSAGFMTDLTGSNTRRETGIYGTFQLSIFEFGGKICMLR